MAGARFSLEGVGAFSSAGRAAGGVLDEASIAECERCAAAFAAALELLADDTQSDEYLHAQREHTLTMRMRDGSVVSRS